jgi:uncharacterized Zn finger protein
MIAIQNPQQFERAADRLRTERQSIRRHEPGLYRVENKAKGHAYHVRIERRDGRTFGTCTCEAGTPSNHRHAPMICKHLAAVVLFLRAVRAMRQRATAH